MDIRKRIQELMTYVREGELCSCPYLVFGNNGYDVAVFTYFAFEEDTIKVYGYGQVIAGKGNQIICEEKELFQSENDIIEIADAVKVSIQERDEMYDSYYTSLQKVVDNEVSDKDEVARAFRKIISNDAIQLYKKICLDFLDAFGIE